MIARILRRLALAALVAIGATVAIILTAGNGLQHAIAWAVILSPVWVLAALAWVLKPPH